MAVLRHPNIVMFLGACYNPPCMVTEYCARGSLLDILCRARDDPVRYRMLIEGLQHLIDLGMHRSPK